MSTMKHNFNVGDGCSFGAGSDSYPGTVVKVTPTRIWVQQDTHICTKRMSAYGANDAEYIYQRNLNGRIEQFSVKKNGRITLKGCNFGGLGHGRRYYQDPSF